ncbi:Hypothetical_protein [Hexamita inflata]|uniref:Hypothetical_protein n=1 Tax=Hexamita inflata TaxID=28002 RepID=A0AA86PCH1_9EUKA|nr:Hypothetical protein HINF_LOCUS20992 [Hexamita inflata]
MTCHFTFSGQFDCDNFKKQFYFSASLSATSSVIRADLTITQNALNQLKLDAQTNNSNIFSQLTVVFSNLSAINSTATPHIQLPSITTQYHSLTHSELAWQISHRAAQNVKNVHTGRTHDLA